MKIKIDPIKSILEQKYQTPTLDYELLESNIKGLIDLHQKIHKDTWIMCCGMPGTGKSKLILWIWQLINEYQKTPCILRTDVIETYNGLLRFLKEHYYVYGKTGLVDEGAFFAPARKSMEADQRDLNEVMDVIRKRQKRILVAGSKPWKLDMAVRERTDAFLRTFYNISLGEYQFAYYSGTRIHSVLCDEYAKGLFPDPIKFFKVCPPDFYGAIPKIDDVLDKEYQKYKDEFGLEFIEIKIQENESRLQKHSKSTEVTKLPILDEKLSNTDDLNSNEGGYLYKLTPELREELMKVEKPDHKSRYRKVNNGMKRVVC